MMRSDQRLVVVPKYAGVKERTQVGGERSQAA